MVRGPQALMYVHFTMGQIISVGKTVELLPNPCQLLDFSVFIVFFILEQFFLMRFVLKYNNLFQLDYTYTSGCQCKCKRSLDWNNPDGIKCAKETTPVLNMSTQLQVGTDRRVFMVAANVTRSMKVPVYFLNITTLSEYRKDAHTSVYTIRQGKMLTPEQKADPATYADCIHWCLPGLPDTWNEFLYTRIISRS